MFVLSKAQLISMLGGEQMGRQIEQHQIDDPMYKTWLDLGAGDGGALERLGARFLKISKKFLIIFKSSDNCQRK